MYHDFEKNLPHWAVSESSGDFMVIGTQLCTKDGRNCGNAFVNGLRIIHNNKIADIVTYSGTNMSLTLDELKELFFEPKFIMDITEARLKFCK